MTDEAELSVITDYLAGFMTEEEMVAFDERLASDQAFFDRTAPFLRIWFLRVPPSIIEAGLKERQPSIPDRPPGHALLDPASPRRL